MQWTKQDCFLEGLHAAVQRAAQGQRFCQRVFVERVSSLPTAPRGDERLCGRAPKVLWSVAVVPSRQALQQFQECEAEAAAQDKAVHTTELLSASRLVLPTLGELHCK